MKCKNFKKLIFQELDGNISEEKLNILKNHLTVCKQCSDEYILLKNVYDMLKSEKLVPVPEGFQQDLHTKLLNYNKKLSSVSFSDNRFYFKQLVPICVAIFIAVFSFNTAKDLYEINKNDIDELPQIKSQQITASENPQQDENIKNDSDSDNATKNNNSKKEINNFSKQIAADNEQVITQDVPPAVIPENTKETSDNLISEDNNIINNEEEELNIATFNQESVANDDSKSGGTSARSVSKNENEKYIEIDLIGETDLSEIEIKEIISDSSYLIDIKYLEKIKELIKDKKFVIYFEDEETVKKDYFKLNIIR